MDPIATSEHQRWLRILAYAEDDHLENAWQDLLPRPHYTLARPTETGLVMMKARVSGSGKTFNFCEVTVTRAAVELDCGARGISYRLGCRTRQAELAAVFHALLQKESRRADIEARLLVPADARRRQREALDAAELAATRVDFATLVRGDG